MKLGIALVELDTMSYDLQVGTRTGHCSYVYNQAALFGGLNLQIKEVYVRYMLDFIFKVTHY